MSFAAYLVGTWERRYGIGTSLQIINPMTYNLDIRVAFLDDDEHFIRCLDYRLSPNKLQEIIVPNLGLDPTFGVVKIISHENETVKEGIVGFQRQILATAIAGDVEVRRGLSLRDLVHLCNFWVKTESDCQGVGTRSFFMQDSGNKNGPHKSTAHFQLYFL